MKNVLVVSHAHPDFSKGGGELAAYNAYQGFREMNPQADVRFLAVVNHGVLPGKVVAYKPSEFLLGACVEDGSVFRNHSTLLLKQSFEELTADFKPDLVSFHHYFNIGLDALVMLRRLLPNAKFVMTLHEFLAICLNDGQMIKRNSTSLCTASSEFLCGKCFPEHDLSFFAKRKSGLLSVFSLFDQFVSPSTFLMQRYVDWGIPAHKITVVENGHAREEEKNSVVQEQALRFDVFGSGVASKTKRAATQRQPNVFGFFGQINPYKGLDVVLMALQQLLCTEGIPKLVIEVNGANFEAQKDELRDRIRALSKPLQEAGWLRWNGPYERAELASRMQRVDWVLMPSVWWENSPMIIQESFIHQKPVICSDIGGMREKVIHGKTGIHVSAGSVTEWADVLLKASQASALHEKLKNQLPSPPTCLDMAKQYEELL
jgi:glycosyltransferase involved in cell wall biosynthesis